MKYDERKKEYSLTYYDEFGAKQLAKFKSREYHNLMELLFDKYLEEWGDCKGKGLCGTCHIKITEGAVNQEIDEVEKNTLSKCYNTNKESRLACKIPLNSKLNGIVFKMVTGI